MKYINRNLVLDFFRLFNGYPINTFLSGNGVILAFHRVVEGQISNFNYALEITSSRFESILNYFKKQNYEFISLDTMLYRLADRAPRKFAVITFDDGYKDNYTHAYPILKSHKIPFAIYPSLNFPERKAVIWWYLLEEMIENNTEISFIYNEMKNTYECRTVLDKDIVWNSIRKFIIESSLMNIKERLNAVFAPYFANMYDRTDDLALSWEELKLLVDDPLVTIGNHTNNHFALAKLTEDDVITEVTTAEEIFRKKLGLTTKHLAYPFGTRNEVSQKTAEIIRKLGYSTAVTTIQGSIFPEHLNLNNRFLLPRYSVCDKISQYDINVRLNGVYAFLRNNYHKVTTL